MIFYGIGALVLIGLAVWFVIEDKKKKCCNDGKIIWCDIECNDSDK
jgi:hypothetical protein